MRPNTGGPNAAPMRENSERRRLAKNGTNLRQLEEENEGIDAYANSEREHKYTTKTVSTSHSKTEKNQKSNAESRQIPRREATRRTNYKGRRRIRRITIKDKSRGR